MSSASLEATRTKFHATKSSQGFHLAEKHWHAIAGTPLAAQLKAHVGGDSDEEQELAVVLALTELIVEFDPCAALLNGIPKSST